MDKRWKLFLDFDEVVADTSSAICKYYNMWCKDREGFVPAVPQKLYDWKFTDQCPLFTDNERQMIFGELYLFNNLKPMHGATEAIERLSKHFDIVIATIGTLANISHKVEWFRDHHEIKKNVSQFIYISNMWMDMNKEIVNMKGGIFLDDNTNNLRSSNADYKFIFGRVTNWNNDAGLDFRRMWCWDDAEMKLMQMFIGG